MPGYITKESVEKVRAAADLYDIVSADVTLKASGVGSFVGLCPFHEEKTGSFNIRPSLGTWHCFGCGLGCFWLCGAEGKCRFRPGGRASCG